jgi:hypothetical protein
MLAYIPAPWILWVLGWCCSNNRYFPYLSQPWMTGAQILSWPRYGQGIPCPCASQLGFVAQKPAITHWKTSCKFVNTPQFTWFMISWKNQDNPRKPPHVHLYSWLSGELMIFAYQLIISWCIFFITWWSVVYDVYHLVNIYISMERSTIFFMGKSTNFLWTCSTAIENPHL